MAATAEQGTGGGLLAVREGAQRVLERSGALEPGWRVKGVRRASPRTVVLEVAPGDGDGFVLEWSQAGDPPVPAFLTGAHYAVGYRRAPGAWDLDSAETPSDVKRLAARACEALAHAEPAVALVEAAPAPTRRAVRFDVDDLVAWLAPRLALGDELADGWRLREVHPHFAGALALVFDKEGEELAPRLTLRPRDDGRPAAARTAGLDLTYKLVFGEATDDARAAVHARLAAELHLVLDALDRGVDFVAAAPAAPAGDAPVEAAGPPPALNLAIPAPCGERCTFCSVREEIYPIMDADSAFVRALAEDIRQAGARGTRVLRINGIEPLNAPYLLDLLAIARESGFEDFHLHSTCRPLADRDFCARYLAAMPASYRIYVPIYGCSPEVHDAVTGTEGSFEHVMEAVRNLRELMGEGGTLIFTTVVVKANVADLAAMRDLVKPLGRWWEVHLAFPNTSSRTDRYRDIAVPMGDVLDAVYPKGWWPLADLPLGEVQPCVALAHQHRTGHALVTARRLADRVREPAGTFYRSAGFSHSLAGGRRTAFTAVTAPCPHRDGCALATACHGEYYRLYGELFGTDELRPATRSDLAALPDGDAILALLDAGA